MTSRQHVRICGLLMLVVGAMLVLLWPRESATGTTTNPEAATAVPAEPATATAPSRADGVTTRTSVEVGIPTDPPDPSRGRDRPATFAPYSIVVRTVDELGRAVPFASLRAWPAHESSQPRITSLTDAAGMGVLCLDRELCLLQATKDETLDSGKVRVWHGTARNSPEQVLVLQSLVSCSVLVLDKAGSPVAGASVEASSHGWLGTVTPQAPAPQTTDSRGRCRFLVHQSQSLALSAKEGSATTLSAYVMTLGAEAIEVVLRFPGALTIVGRLTAADGQPTGGEVRVTELTSERQRVDRVLHSGALPMEPRSTRTAPSGQWRVDLPHAGTFELVGSAFGHANSRVARVEVTDADPHRTIELRLLAPAAIRGCLVRADGTPIGGGFVKIEPEGDAGVDDRFGSARTANLADDGRFTFAGAHPDATYRLSATPDLGHRSAKVTRSGVVPGGPELRIVIRDEELETGRIAGTVVRAVSGHPVAAFRQWLVLYRDGKCVGIQPEERIESAAGRFRSDELAHGETYGLAIAADGLAPALAGPVEIAQREHRFEVRLEEQGRVSVRVLEPGGAPARYAQTGIERRTQGVPQTSWLGPRRTDGRGQVTFDKLAPGGYEITATRPGKHAATPCEVRAGETTEVEIMLPR